MGRTRNRNQNVAPSRKLDVAKKPEKGFELPETDRRQAAALVFRISEERGLEILLLSSRRTGRAVLPKGWLNAGEEDYKAAAREAYEEAGIVGRIAHKPVGSYEYWKELTTGSMLLRVDVYPLEVEHQRKKWPEQGHRELRWCRPTDAAKMVAEPALAALIRWFTPPD